MKQEIERRRAEAAEKRHRVEDTTDGESRRPFQCLGPKTGSMKVGPRSCKHSREGGCPPLTHTKNMPMLLLPSWENIGLAATEGSETLRDWSTRIEGERSHLCSSVVK